MLNDELLGRLHDMLELESTILSPSYKSRASQLQGFKHCRVFTLSYIEFYAMDLRTM